MAQMSKDLKQWVKEELPGYVLLTRKEWEGDGQCRLVHLKTGAVHAARSNREMTQLLSDKRYVETLKASDEVNLGIMEIDPDTRRKTAARKLEDKLNDLVREAREWLGDDTVYIVLDNQTARYYFSSNSNPYKAVTGWRDGE